MSGESKRDVFLRLLDAWGEAEGFIVMDRSIDQRTDFAAVGDQRDEFLRAYDEATP